MLSGAVKGLPFAAALGAISARDVALYASVMSVLAGVLVLGAIWSAAKAWRERAEARTDESEQLTDELVKAQADRHKQDERIAALEATIAELRRRTDVEAIGNQLGADHREMISAIKGMQAALEFMFRQAFPAAVFHVTETGDTDTKKEPNG